MGPGRVPVGRVAERRARRDEGRAAADRRAVEASPAALSLGRRVRLCESPHRAHPQGDPAEPEPVRQLLGSRALERCLREPGGVPRRRRRDPARGGRRAGAPRRDVHPARCAALPLASRPDLPGLLREPRLAGRPLARARPRARQPGLRQARGRDLRHASVSREPGVEMARRGRLRLAGRAAVRARERASG